MPGYSPGFWKAFVSTNEKGETKCMTKEHVLYDLKVLGKLESEGSVEVPALCLAYSESEDIVFSVNGSLNVVQSHEEISSVDFEASIDALCFCSGIKMVLVVDASGKLHMVSTDTTEVILTHKVIDVAVNETGNKKRKCCCAILCEEDKISNGIYHIAVGLGVAKIALFSNVSLQSLLKAHNTKDSNLMREVLTSMKISSCDTSPIHGGLMSIMAGSCSSSQFMTWGGGVLACWGASGDIIMGNQNADMRLEGMNSQLGLFESEKEDMVKIVPYFGYALCLFNKGSLCLCQSPSMIAIQFWCEVNIKDFIIMDDVSGDSACIKLCAVVAKDDGQQLELCIFEMPSFTMVFQSSTGPTLCQLAFGLTPPEDIVFASMNPLDNGNSELKLLLLNNVSPEDRYLRLLNKRQFDEAELFAEAFKLNPQQAYHQKALHLAKAIMDNDKGDIRELFQSLKDCLEKVDDRDTVAEICLYTEFADLNMSYSLLVLGRSRLATRIHAGNGDGVEFNGSGRDELLHEIIERLDRLVTFNIAFGSSECEDWIRFSHSTLSEELTTYLTNGNLYAAETILKRHQASVLDRLLAGGHDESEATARGLYSLLDCIPHHIHVDVIVRWLKTVLLPALLTRIRCSVKVIAVWLHTRAEKYESTHISEWPENGLQMANVLFDFQKNHGIGNKQLTAACQEFRSNSVEIERLRLLVARLQNLLNLRKKFDCHVSLAEFMEETAKSLTFRMLDRVMVPELIPVVLEKTVLPYMKENGFSEEDILLGYIEDSVSRMNKRNLTFIESLLERRIIAIINCLADPQILVLAAAKTSHRASIPWSENMHALVDKAIFTAKAHVGSKDSDDVELVNKMNGLLEDLQNSRYVEKIPTILSQYGLKDVNTMMPRVQQRVVRYLIHQGTDEALKHADIFCKTFTTIPRSELHRYRLVEMLNSKKYDKAVELLIEVEDESKDMAIALVKHMLILAMIKLDRSDDEDRIHYCSCAISMVEHVLPRVSATEKLEFAEKLKLLRNISALQTRCGEYMSLEDYTNEDVRSTLLAKKIDEYSSQGATGMMMKESLPQDTFMTLNCTEQHQIAEKSLRNETLQDIPKQSHATNIGNLLEIASLLGVDRDQIRLWLAHNSAKSGRKGVSTAVQICKELLRTSLDEETADTSLSIALDSIKLLNSNSLNLAADIFSIAIEAIMFCKPENIGTGIEMCYLYKFASTFRKVMDGTNTVTSQQNDFQDIYDNFETLYPWMVEDDGFLLQSYEVSPIFLTFASALFTEFPINREHGAIELYFCKLRESVLALTSILQRVGRPQLALSWTVNCFSIALRRLANLGDLSDEAEGSFITNLLVESINALADMLPQYVMDCIKRTLHGENVDTSLMTGLLTLLPIGNVEEFLLSELELAGDNAKRIMGIARAGVQILLLNSMHSKVCGLERLFIDAQWSENFKSLKIPFDRNVMSKRLGKMKSLHALVHHPESTGGMIKEFCNDYDLDSESALLDFLRVLLAAPSCVVSESEEKQSNDRTLLSLHDMPLSSVNMRYIHWNNTGAVDELIDNDDSIRPWDSVMKEAKFVQANVRDKRLLAGRLVHILRSETCPYSYKRAQTLLNLISYCKETHPDVDVNKGLQLIHCLWLVKRNTPMGEHERDHWSFPKMAPTLMRRPEISRERLPLHPFLFGDSSSVWKILNPEFNEHTASGLVPIAQVLSLSADKLYVSAVDNYISKHMDHKNTMRLSINEKQMVTLKRLTSQIEDHSLATALAKRIADLLPVCDQKVGAYVWSAEIASKWEKSVSSSSAKEVVTSTHKKLVEMSNDVSMQLILQKHNLLSKNTSMLTSSPERLIHFLYQHPSIVERYYIPSDAGYPDILAATSQIAEFHSLNIFKMHLKLAMEFLSMDDENEANICGDFVRYDMTKLTQASRHDQNLQTSSALSTHIIRVLYILRNRDPKPTAKALLKFACDRKNVRLTNRIRVCVFHCILQLFDDHIIEEVTKQNISSFRKRVRLVVYLAELESIGFEIDGPQLEKSNKGEIARSILAIPKLCRNPNAICMAAELCREFNAWCPTTWQMLLQQLVVLKQIKYLRDVLPGICSQPTISSLPCLATVWQSCVLYPLTAMTSPLKEEEEIAAVASYDFLLTCPVLLEMDIGCVIKSFSDINFPLLALGCHLICPMHSGDWKRLVADKYETIQIQLKKYPSVPGHQRVLLL